MKLLNRGKRTIIHGQINFKPGALMDFPDDVGAQIKNLFSGEVQSLDDAKKVFEEELAEKAVAEEPKNKPRNSKKEDFEDQDKPVV